MKSLSSIFIMKKFLVLALGSFFLFGCEFGTANLFGEPVRKADLTVPNVRIERLADPGRYLFEITVNNQGNAPVNKNFSIYGLVINNPSKNSHIHLSFDAQKNPLSAGEKTVIRQEIFLPALQGQEGTYQFSADICPFESCFDQIAETDETNNDGYVFFSL